MNEYVEVRTQAELDNALKKPGVIVLIKGNGYFEACDSSQVRAYDSSQVRAYDSSQVRAYGSSQVTAYDSSQVTACDSSQVTAYDSSQVTAYDSSQVTAYGSSQVTAYDSSQVTAYDSSQVTAYDSSQVTACDSSQVTAYDSSQVTACDSSQVTASKYVAVTRDVINGQRAKITGGVLIEPILPTTGAEWCETYGVEVKRGIAILYKGLDENFKSGYDFYYKPGSKPQAPDWDGGEKECGGGLHFSPTPGHTLRFVPEAKRFVGCPVKVKDIVVHEGATYPAKVKAPGCCGLVFEVDIHGNVLEAKEKAA